MSTEYREALELQDRAAQDRMRLATAQNAATNGRLFCVTLAAANLVGGSPFLAAMCAVPIGAAYLAEIPKFFRLRSHLSMAAVATSIGVALATLVNLW